MEPVLPSIPTSRLPAPPGRQQQQIAKVGQEFEALLAEQMLKAMRATVGKNDLLKAGFGEDVYRSMLDQEYARAIAARGELGIAKGIIRELGQRAPTRPSGP